jgi:hypothetical protein
MAMLSPTSRPDFVSRLHHRPMRGADVPECMALLPPWLDLDARQRERLPTLWERLAEHPAIIAGVAIEMALPPGQQVQCWGTTLAMPSSWLESIAPDGKIDPALGARATRDIYAALLDGSLQPPDEREIGRANAQNGVVFMALHYRQTVMDLDDPYALRVLHTANESFRLHHAGHHIRAFFQQATLADEPWLTAAGFRRRHDPLPGPANPHTVLFGLTREEARSTMPGSSARHVFEHQPPRFRFSASQRRLLWLALFDESDEALMSLLDVSVHGLKKLWRGIYERIEDALPDFFGDDPSDDDAKRGPEKRRQVLAYVRQRPEELRPWTPGA